ncbi:hypothetical protein [Kitasatospora sp. NPDC058046]|uniref:hypothetical protein n=1 Tax=Kitasatospora sp. NPDC058046 TaxID=3346312 RepID=UPI0036D7A839
MPSYYCGKCGTTSRAYLTAAGAHQHGADHRTRAHGGDHPDGECLVANAPFMPRAGEDWRLILAMVALLALAGFCSRFIS